MRRTFCPSGVSKMALNPRIASFQSPMATSSSERSNATDTPTRLPPPPMVAARLVLPEVAPESERYTQSRGEKKLSRLSN
jgi:hypothetical protein